MSILDFFKGKKEANKEQAKERKYPTLEEYVGTNEKLTLHYLDLGTPKIEQLLIKDPCYNDVSFYAADKQSMEGRGCRIFWNKSVSLGKNGKEEILLNSVKKIVDKDGKVIYENKELKFDYANAKVSDPKLIDTVSELKEAKEKK